jgi:hypothetical protein
MKPTPSSPEVRRLSSSLPLLLSFASSRASYSPELALLLVLKRVLSPELIHQPVRRVDLGWLWQIGRDWRGDPELAEGLLSSTTH